MITFVFQNGITRSFNGKLAQLQCTDTKKCLFAVYYQSEE